MFWFHYCNIINVVNVVMNVVKLLHISYQSTLLPTSQRSMRSKQFYSFLIYLAPLILYPQWCCLSAEHPNDLNKRFLRFSLKPFRLYFSHVHLNVCFCPQFLRRNIMFNNLTFKNTFNVAIFYDLLFSIVTCRVILESPTTLHNIT